MHRWRSGWVRVVIAVIVAAAGFAAGGGAPAPHPTHAQNPCDGLVAPRLQTGAQARVITTYGLSLKNEPRTGAAGAVERRLLPFDTVATVTGGYTCNFGYVWWELQLPDGTTGWAAEGGSAGDYYMEPVTVGLHVFRRAADGATLERYFVTPDARAEPRGTITVAPVEANGGDVWQLVEIDRLRVLLDDARANCPDRLTGTPFADGDVNAALKLPLPPLEYDLYPAPDGQQAVIVRHLHLRVPRCETVIPERVGISRVSLLNADGSEVLLFPFPQHPTVPDSIGNYTISEPGEWGVYLDEVVWSPHSRYIAFTAAYRDNNCAIGRCLRFHVFVSKLETGELFPLGEGRHVGWTAGGEGINVFRLSYEIGGQPKPVLQTMRPNGFDRQDMWLPGGAVYFSAAQFGFGFPWNASGTRVLVANAGEGEVMLFELATRDFTSRVAIPDRMSALNRLAVHLVRSETSYLWATIRGDFALQSVSSGRWEALESTLTPTGIAPRQVRPFADGSSALVEMVDGSAYVLDFVTDRLAPVTFAP